jgi:hypothetical protein
MPSFSRPFLWDVKQAQLLATTPDLNGFLSWKIGV